MVFTAYVLCNLRLFKLKTKGKQYKQNILLRNKYLYSWVSLKSGFEQPDSGDYVVLCIY